MLEEQQLEAQTLHRLLGYRPHGTTKDDDDGEDELACTPLFAFLSCYSACTGCWDTDPMARLRNVMTWMTSWPVRPVRSLAAAGMGRAMGHGQAAGVACLLSATVFKALCEAVAQRPGHA